MPYVLGRVKVEDYTKWKSGFGAPEGNAMRKAAGAKSWQIFHTEDDADDIVVLLEWDNLENARKYYQSKEFQEAQPSAGVTRQVETLFLEEVERGSV
jgi:heme-degrading monooxygenase HmoA